MAGKEMQRLESKCEGSERSVLFASWMKQLFDFFRRVFKKCLIPVGLCWSSQFPLQVTKCPNDSVQTKCVVSKLPDECPKVLNVNENQSAFSLCSQDFAIKLLSTERRCRKKPLVDVISSSKTLCVLSV